MGEMNERRRQRNAHLSKSAVTKKNESKTSNNGQNTTITFLIYLRQLEMS